MSTTWGRHSHCASSSRGTFALPGTEARYERSLPFRFLHLDLDVRIVIDQGGVAGKVTHTIERVDKNATELSLDAIDCAIDRVEVDAGQGFEAAPHDYDETTLKVRIGARFQSGKVRVTYRAWPRRGLYFLKPDAKVPDRPHQVWSQCQDEDARHWFPCHDKPHVKVPADFRYTVPRAMQVLGNGELVKKTVSKAKGRRGGTARYHYRMSHPLSSYLVTLVVGQFEIIRDRDAVLPSGRTVPVEYWVPKGRSADGRRAFDGTPRKIELFSRCLGAEYPFSRYTQVVVSDFIFGGMENTTATTMYEHVLLDERAALDIDSHDLVAHELAHQWFGDWLTCRDWPEAWLNEGFATYFEHVDAEDRKGSDEYLFGIERDLESYLGEARGRYERPIVCREYSEPIDLFDRHLYEKGSLVLHLLRRELGDDVFWAGLSRYAETHANSSVTTFDLQRALEQVSGRSLDRVFHEWVRRAGHPELKVKVSWENKTLLVAFTQTQKATPYELHLEIEVRRKGGKVERHSLDSSQRHAAISVSLADRPEYVAIDPDLRIPGEMTVEASSEMLRNQLLFGSTVRVRRTAARLLGSKHDFKTAEVLRRVLLDEKAPWNLRAACASSLGKLHHEAALDALQAAATTRSPETRAAVAEALAPFREESTVPTLQKLLTDPSYLVSAAATLALGKSGSSEAKPLLEKQLQQSSWGDVVCSAAVDAMAELRDPSLVPLIKKQTEYGTPTRARRNAVVALARLARTADTRAHLRKLLDDRHPHFRMAVVAALEEMGDTKSRGILVGQLERDTDGRVVRRIREALAKLDRSRPNREMLDKIAELERNVTELQGRLATMEAKKKGR